MKKLLVLILAFGLLCANLCAVCEDDASALAKAAGLDIVGSDNAEGAIFCDYSVDSSTHSSMLWSDAAQIYTVSGDPATVSQLYVDALALGGWESCRYIVGKKARISFGTKSKKVCGTLDEYLDQMQQALGVTATASAAATAGSADFHDYILNTNSKKFHYPDCPGVAKMKDKNKKAFTGKREDVIAMGYDPCGQCNP